MTTAGSHTHTWSGLGTAKGRIASKGTTQGEIDVPRFFPRNGPRGTYSHFYTAEFAYSYVRACNIIFANFTDILPKFCQSRCVCVCVCVCCQLADLNIPGTPVIHQYHTKYMVLGLRYGNGLPQLVAGANKECLFDV